MLSGCSVDAQYGSHMNSGSFDPEPRALVIEPWALVIELFRH